MRPGRHPPPTARDLPISTNAESGAPSRTVMDWMRKPEEQPEEREGPERDALFDRLPERERHILNLIADGLSEREIAMRLGLSEERVDGLIRGLLTELGFGSKDQAALYVMSRDIGAASGPTPPEEVQRDDAYRRLTQEPDESE
jgi:DNA-binding CsgD family transcriptional regulator